MAVVVATALICSTGVSAEAAPGRQPVLAQLATEDLNGTVTAEADGDLTFTLDPRVTYDSTAMQQRLDETEALNPRLSDTVKAELEQFPVGIGSESASEWVDFDGTLRMTADHTGLSLTINASDVQASETWSQWAFAMAMGYLSKYLTVLGCLYLFPELARACSIVGGFTGALIRGLVTQFFNHQLGDAGAYQKTFLKALKAALWVYAKGKLLDWLESKFPGLVTELSNALREQAWSWAKDAANWVAEVLRDMAEMLPDGIAEWGPPPPGTADAPLRVMVVGDSMTQGDEGDWTWRYRLWEWFKDQGVNVDFVGPYSGTKNPPEAAAPAPPPFQGSPPTPSGPPPTTGGYSADADPAFDRDHFAVWGRQAAQDKTLIRQVVQNYKPDLLLVGLGFNDMGWFVSGPEGTLDSMRTLVSEARAAKPDINFALANVPQRTRIGGREDLIVNTDAYNRMLADAIPQWSTILSPVALVDWRGNYGCGPDSCPAGYDGLHPNALGEFQIAQAFERTLHTTYHLGFSVPGFSGPLFRPTPTPSNVSAEAVPSGIKVTWDRAYGAHGYDVQYRIRGAADWSQFHVSTNRFDTAWTIDGLAWEYQVRTNNGDQTSDWSPVVSAISHPQTAPPPTDIATHATATGVDVSWTPPTGDFTGSIDRYEVITWDVDTPGTFIESVGVRGTSGHIGGLIPGRRYLIAVATWNAVGGGLPEIAHSVIVGGGTPAVPTGLKVTSTDPTTVQLSWNGSSGAAGYQVWIRSTSVDSGGTYEPDTTTADSTSHTVAFLFPGTWNYEFCVSAFNGNDESRRSHCVVAPRPPDTGAGDPATGDNPAGPFAAEVSPPALMVPGSALDEFAQLNKLAQSVQLPTSTTW